MIIDNVKWFEVRKERGYESWKELYQGVLYFTNERLILKTDNETKNIKIDTIIDVEMWKDGVELSRIKGKNILLGKLSAVDIYIKLLILLTLPKAVELQLKQEINNEKLYYYFSFYFFAYYIYARI